MHIGPAPGLGPGGLLAGYHQHYGVQDHAYWYQQHKTNCLAKKVFIFLYGIGKDVKYDWMWD